MGGVIQRCASGKLVRCDSGVGLIRGPCGSTPGCLDCEVTPYQFDVTFTGVELAFQCLQCMEFGGPVYGSVSIVPGSILGGPYRLTQSQDMSDPNRLCTWYGQTTDVTVQAWGNPDCTGPVNHSVRAEIVLRRVLGGFYLDVQTVGGEPVPGGGGTIAQLFTRYTPAASAKCASDLPPILNDFTWHTCFFGTATLGKNGFATLEAVAEEGI